MAVRSSFAYVAASAGRYLVNKRSYAAYSALALIAVQVIIGITMKLAQDDGKYAFSPSGSIAISEFLKMMLSAFFFYQEWKLRAGYARVHAQDAGRMSPLGASLMREGKLSDGDEEDLAGLDEEEDPFHRHLELETGKPLQAGSFWQAVRNEVSEHIVFGLCGLALCYVLVNNLVSGKSGRGCGNTVKAKTFLSQIFVGYRLADPATIQLTRSGVTFITAMVMRFMLHAQITGKQWLSLVMQVCGLVVTQYDPSAGTQLGSAVYWLLIFQVFLSSIAGVFNQSLLQTEKGSLHAINFYLYGAGTCINLLCHVLLRLIKPGEPGLFEGYGSFGAIMIIVSNVFIGLAINAVYKYADAVIKCLATAIGTTILISASPILFGTSFTLLIVPGSIVIFLSSGLYITLAGPKPSITASTREKVGELAGLSTLWHRRRRFCILSFAAALFNTLAVVGFTMTTNFASQQVTTRKQQPLQSPFKNSMAFIRWNQRIESRVPHLMKYEPFFDTIHISLPDGTAPDSGLNRISLKNDAATITFTIYRQVAYTMQAILDSDSKIDGMLYFHFDAWIDPLAWTGMDLESIHFPFISPALAPVAGPVTLCMSNTSELAWHGWSSGMHEKAMQAAAALKQKSTEYVVNEREWCVGWSDIYFIPRRFFKDFIYLSEVFLEQDLFHEVAIPTIVHIIDQTRRTNPFIPIVNKISDCWVPIVDRSRKLRRNKRKFRNGMPLRQRIARLGESLSTSDKPYLSYYDASLTVGDVRSLKNDWLTDNVITFWQEYLERETLPRYPQARICLLRPSMAFLLMRANDLRHANGSLPDLTKVTHIFLPINDNRNVADAEGGSHWSLLLVSVHDGLAFHYDSLGSANFDEGKLATRKLSQLLRRELRFINLDDSPQQENGSDCGVFVCLLMRHLLVKRLLGATAREKVSMSMGGKMVDSYGGRKEMLRIIDNLRKEAERRRS
ncbi:cmp-sialic acid transporter [Cordyceps javanica]|uniref:Cmp-sialic acid transporter n=1 Tax=Cordyceps javanica TaxID=43265 RepID=A0A545ULQ3_9HYPO|nr:cmp-sialic acid transporter [Cordyceps javanica]